MKTALRLRIVYNLTFKKSTKYTAIVSSRDFVSVTDLTKGL